MKAESHVKDNFIYVVVGKSENVYQDKIGGHLSPTQIQNQ